MLKINRFTLLISLIIPFLRAEGSIVQDQGFLFECSGPRSRLVKFIKEHCAGSETSHPQRHREPNRAVPVIVVPFGYPFRIPDHNGGGGASC
jgi:hypothetical protein